MTDPAPEEITKAYAALFGLADFAVTQAEDKEEADMMRAYNNHILKALPPKPQPTMAEVEWDDDKHHLAEAEDEHGIRMIMVSDELDFIRCMQPPNAGGIVLGVPKKDLTPTGRRYTLKGN